MGTMSGIDLLPIWNLQIDDIDGFASKTDPENFSKESRDTIPVHEEPKKSLNPLNRVKSAGVDSRSPSTMSVVDPLPIRILKTDDIDRFTSKTDPENLSKESRDTKPVHEEPKHSLNPLNRVKSAGIDSRSLQKVDPIPIGNLKTDDIDRLSSKDDPNALSTTTDTKLQWKIAPKESVHSVQKSPDVAPVSLDPIHQVISGPKKDTEVTLSVLSVADKIAEIVKNDAETDAKPRDHSSALKMESKLNQDQTKTNRNPVPAQEDHPEPMKHLPGAQEDHSSQLVISTDPLRDEWLAMKAQLESQLNDEKLRLERRFGEELASMKSKFQSDMELHKSLVSQELEKAKLAKEEILRMEQKLTRLIDVNREKEVIKDETEVKNEGKEVNKDEKEVKEEEKEVKVAKKEEKDVKDEETEVKKEEKEVLKDEKEIKNEGKEVKVAKKEEKYVKDEVTESKKEEKEVINEKKDVKEVKEVKKDEKRSIRTKKRSKKRKKRS